MRLTQCTSPRFEQGPCQRKALASPVSPVDNKRRRGDAAIRKKYPHSRADRLELRVSDRQLEYDLEEQRSGKWHEGRPPADDTIKWGFPIRTNPPGFRHVAIPIIQDIETWSGVTLPRSNDGCPYFAHANHNPNPNWNWTICYH